MGAIVPQPKPQLNPSQPPGAAKSLAAGNTASKTGAQARIGKLPGHQVRAAPQKLGVVKTIALMALAFFGGVASRVRGDSTSVVTPAAPPPPPPSPADLTLLEGHSQQQGLTVPVLDAEVVQIINEFVPLNEQPVKATPKDIASAVTSPEFERIKKVIDDLNPDNFKDEKYVNSYYNKLEISRKYEAIQQAIEVAAYKLNNAHLSPSEFEQALDLLLDKVLDFEQMQRLVGPNGEQHRTKSLTDEIVPIIHERLFNEGPIGGSVREPNDPSVLNKHKIAVQKLLERRTTLVSWRFRDDNLIAALKRELSTGNPRYLDTVKAISLRIDRNDFSIFMEFYNASDSRVQKELEKHFVNNCEPDRLSGLYRSADSWRARGFLSWAAALRGWADFFVSSWIKLTHQERIAVAIKHGPTYKVTLDNSTTNQYLMDTIRIGFKEAAEVFHIVDTMQAKATNEQDRKKYANMRTLLKKAYDETYPVPMLPILILTGILGLIGMGWAKKEAIEFFVKAGLGLNLPLELASNLIDRLDPQDAELLKTDYINLVKLCPGLEQNHLFEWYVNQTKENRAFINQLIEKTPANQREFVLENLMKPHDLFKLTRENHDLMMRLIEATPLEKREFAIQNLLIMKLAAIKSMVNHMNQSNTNFDHWVAVLQKSLFDIHTSAGEDNEKKT